MSEFYDAKETQSRDERETGLFSQMPAKLAAVVKQSAGWSSFLSDIDLEKVVDRNALSNLPVLRKSDLKEMQSKKPPLAGFSVGNNETHGRVFMSPGPIFEPMGPDKDHWRSARSLYAAGFRKGDLLHNKFS